MFSANATAVLEYEDKMDEIYNAGMLVVFNDTTSLFTVTLGGVTIVPDLSSLSYSTALDCPEGMTNVTFYCGQYLDVVLLSC